MLQRSLQSFVLFLICVNCFHCHYNYNFPVFSIKSTTTKSLTKSSTKSTSTESTSTSTSTMVSAAAFLFSRSTSALSKASTSSRRFMSTSTTIIQSLQQTFANTSPPPASIGQNIPLALESLAKADAVCFDVDSTVLAEEGIDVLADYLGKGEAVAELTRNAMEGSTKFQDALRMRLDLMQPSNEQILRCLQDRPLQLSPGIEQLIEALHDARKDVYFVSGGFRIMIEPIARELCVSKTNIYANTILFDDDGNYTGFDDTEPTSRDMGKPRALEMIQNQHGYETIVMVGDGATDAQAKPPAKAFIGYGGVVVREAVKEKACWFVHNFDEMKHVVQKFGTRK